MEDTVLSYLELEDKGVHDNWDELSELTRLRDIASLSSSTLENQVNWGNMPVLIGEEIHHEEI